MPCFISDLGYPTKQAIKIRNEKFAKPK